MSTLIPTGKKETSNKINQIKSRIMHKIWPNKRQNTLKRVSNRGIKSLENNFSAKATKNIIENPPIVVEPKIVTSSKIATKRKIIDKSEIVVQKKHQNYDEYKNQVIKQLKKTLKKVV